ncbi:MAG: hypothetical protein JXB88_26050 [Spirochaetales bacterium]|nr:hypothetical protein [Spirochaetales bacterium]
MLDATILKNSLKPALINFWESCYHGDEGMTIQEYAETFAGIIASKVVEHIKANALVSTTLSGSAGPYSIVGTGSGGVS